MRLDGTFADWVAPIAARYAATRREVSALATQIPSDAWGLASPVEGWRYRDVLAHLAEGDVSVRHMIQTVLDDGDTDFRAWNNGREVRVATGLERGASLGIVELIAKAMHDGEETQLLLASLSDQHEAVQMITSRTNPAPQSLGEFLAGYHHDEEHLEHLRPALATEKVTL